MWNKFKQLFGATKKELLLTPKQRCQRRRARQAMRWMGVKVTK